MSQSRLLYIFTPISDRSLAPLSPFMNDDVTEPFGSLSLSPHDSGDDMDIDETFETHDDGGGLEAPYSSLEPEVEEPPTPTQDRKLLLLTIGLTIKRAFSPTELGACVAMKRPLLLMPPPPSTHSRRPLVVEVDTSHGVVSRLTIPEDDDGDVDMEQVSTPLPAYNPMGGSSLGVFNSGSAVNRNFAHNPTMPTTDSKHYYEIHHHYHIPGQPQQQLGVPHTGVPSVELPPQLQPQYPPMIESELLPMPWSEKATPIYHVYYLSLYVQLAFKAIIMLVGLEFIRRIHNDVMQRVDSQISLAAVAADVCNQRYIRDCVESKVVPATQEHCDDLNRCRQQDPKMAAQYTTQLAFVLGDLLALFVQPFGFKVFLICFLVVFVGNFGFGYLRAKNYYGDADERLAGRT